MFVDRTPCGKLFMVRSVSAIRRVGERRLAVAFCLSRLVSCRRPWLTLCILTFYTGHPGWSTRLNQLNWIQRWTIPFTRFHKCERGSRFQNRQNGRINQLVWTRIISVHTYRLGQRHFFSDLSTFASSEEYRLRIDLIFSFTSSWVKPGILTVSPSPPMPCPECFGFCSFPILHPTNIFFLFFGPCIFNNEDKK